MYGFAAGDKISQSVLDINEQLLVFYLFVGSYVLLKRTIFSRLLSATNTDVIRV